MLTVMDAETIDDLLREMDPDEAPGLLRGVELYVRKGMMPEHEAMLWRQRILAWEQFHRLRS